jgi:type IV pilus assembly protein PilA
LIELLIVVAIIGIIAAIAIPNLLASRRAANEGSAVSALRTIHSCELTYQATTGQGDYGTLDALRTDFLADTVLGSGRKSGYSFVVNPSAPGTRPPTFYVTASPLITSGVGQTGTRRFGISEDNVIRADSVLLTPYTDEADLKSAPPLKN